MCFSIWQEHDKQSISPELVHAAAPPPRQSQDALCQLLLYTVAHTAPQTNHFQGLLKCIYSEPCKMEGWKVWSCDVKEVDAGRICFPSTLHYSGWWCTCQLHALNNERRTRWQENPCLESGLWLSKKKTKKCDWFFICTCLSECQEWM